MWLCAALILPKGNYKRKNTIPLFSITREETRVKTVPSCVSGCRFETTNEICFPLPECKKKKMWRCAVACRGILITAGLITQSRKDLRKRCPIMLQPSQLVKRTYNNAGISSFFCCWFFWWSFMGRYLVCSKLYSTAFYLFWMNMARDPGGREV